MITMVVTNFPDGDILTHDPLYTGIRDNFTGDIMTDIHFSKTPSFKAFKIFTFVMYPLFGVVIVFNNSLIISAVIKYKHLRTSTNVIIVSLAVADLFITPSLFFMRIRDYGNITSEFSLKFLLSVLGACHITSTRMSLVNFVLLATERWTAVVFPLKFKVLGTVKKTLFVVLLAWLYGASFSFIVVIYYHWQKPMSFYKKPYFFVNMLPRVLFIIFSQVNVNGCMIISVLLYGHIYIVIRRRFKSFALSNTTASAQELRTLQQTKKITNMTALTLVAFMIVWLPYSIISDVKPTLGITSAGGAIIYQLIIYLTVSNSFFNMFIYARQSEPFRKAFAEMLHLKKRNNQNQTNRSRVIRPRVDSATDQT